MDMNLDPSPVLDALVRACSQDASVLKPAESQLKSWENRPGFYSILASIFLKHDMDTSVRWLGVLYFKNGVDRYWRRNAPNAIPEDEKASLRHHLISCFNEPVNQIATQLSVLVGKIARLDCPRNWPELVPVLLDAVRSDDILCQQRAMLVFYHVIKSLASKRLPEDRRVFEELTSNVFEFVFSMWETNNSNVFYGLQNGNSFATSVSLERSLLSLKVLRQLIVFGFSDPDQKPVVLNFMYVVYERLDRFLKSKPALELMGSELLPRREKIITTLTKLLLDVQSLHSEFFVKFIQLSLEMATVYNFTNQGNGLVFERFAVNSLNLMCAILKCECYRRAKTKKKKVPTATLR